MKPSDIPVDITLIGIDLGGTDTIGFVTACSKDGVVTFRAITAEKFYGTNPDLVITDEPEEP